MENNLTVKAMFVATLVGKGVFERDAHAIMDIAATKFKELLPEYTVTYDGLFDGYDPAFYNIGYTTVVKPCAYEWFKANKPNAWNLDVFAPSN